MPEIRRIKSPEAAAVTALWDRMCQEEPDGAPLSESGRRNIERMLEIAAWHNQTCCLVAVEDDHVVGFVVCRLDQGDGLLPGYAAKIEEHYVPADHAGDGTLARQLVEAAIAWLRARCGRGTISHLTDKDDQRDRELFASLGFEDDMVCLSLYNFSGDEC